MKYESNKFLIFVTDFAHSGAPNIGAEISSTWFIKAKQLEHGISQRGFTSSEKVISELIFTIKSQNEGIGVVAKRSARGKWFRGGLNRPKTKSGQSGDDLSFLAGIDALERLYEIKLDILLAESTELALNRAASGFIELYQLSASKISEYSLDFSLLNEYFERKQNYLELRFLNGEN